MGNAKNAYIAKQNAVYDEMLNAGRRHGEQYAFDCIEVALHRKFGWGYGRIKKLFTEAMKTMDYYAPSMMRGMEQDIYQERLDRELREIIGGNETFYPFADRYPVVKTAGYQKMPK